MDVSIIIVNYNVRDLLRKCLLSIFKNVQKLDYEVFVVDNASQDGSTDMIAVEFPQVKLIACTENYGFAKANNIAIKQAIGKFVLFLNPDTELFDDSIYLMKNHFETDERIGIIGPKVMTPSGKLCLASRRSIPTLWVSFTRIFGFSKIFPRSKIFARYNMTYLPEDEINEVEAVSGSCLFIRNDILHKIGMFDEIYFLYGEDLDLCYQTIKQGYKVVYYPYAVVLHYGGASSESNFTKSNKAFYDSMWIFYKKYFYKKWLFIFNFLFYITIYGLFNVSQLRLKVLKDKRVGSKR